VDGYREFVLKGIGILCVSRDAGQYRLRVYVEDGAGNDQQIASSFGIFSRPRRIAFDSLRRELRGMTEGVMLNR
jgi:hypothetical protein